MSNTDTTMGGRAHIGFAGSLSRHIESEIETGRHVQSQGIVKAASSPSQRHIDALEELSTYVRNLPEDDQLLYALSQITSALAGSPPKFSPDRTPTARILLARIGGSGFSMAPSNQDTMSELVAVAVKDLVSDVAKERVDIARERDEINAELARMREESADSAGLKEQLDRVLCDVDRLSGEKADLERENEYWRGLAGQDDDPESKPRRQATIGGVPIGDGGDR